MLQVARLFNPFSLVRTVQRPVLLRYTHSLANIEQPVLPLVDSDTDSQDTITQEPVSATQIAPLLYFYKGGSDHHGRRFDDILKLSDYELENGKDYIDWLFPVPEASQSSHLSPKLDYLTRESFKQDAVLTLRMRLALRRMLRFYGFKGHYKNWMSTRNTTSPENLIKVTRPLSRKLFVVRRARHFKRAAYSWFNSNPNDKRMMRILRSLRCIGLEAEAEGFFQALKQVFESQEGYPKPIHPSVYKRWRKAARLPLRFAPHWRQETIQRMAAQGREDSIKSSHVLSTKSPAWQPGNSAFSNIETDEKGGQYSGGDVFPHHETMDEESY